MSVYSTNQNRQLYVAAGIESSLAAIQPAAKKGYVYVGSDVDGCKFINQNGHGGIVISDLVNPDKIMWATATCPADTEIKLNAVTVSLNSNFNSGNLVAGEDYILRINFRQLYGMSDEDIYQKYGAVHCTSAMVSTPALFYKAMIYSLVKNFSRLYSPLVEIGVATNADGTGGLSNIVAKATKDKDGTVHLYKQDGTEISATPAAIYIAEKNQTDEWILGTKPYTPVYFEIVPTTVKTSTGEEGIWGTVNDSLAAAKLPTPIGNGYKYADLEYFCMGERGDQYRNIMWPESIITKYFVDPTQTYYSLDIHYAYQGTCEDIQKSEKTLTVIATAKATIDAIITAMGIEDLVTYTSAYDGDTTNAIVAGKTVTERIAGKADKT